MADLTQKVNVRAYKSGQLRVEGKKRYDRESLLQLQFKSAATCKPKGLPDIPEISLDKVKLVRHRLSHSPDLLLKDSDLEADLEMMLVFLRSLNIPSTSENLQEIEEAINSITQVIEALQKKDVELEHLKEIINKLVNKLLNRQEDNAEKADALEKAFREIQASESKLEKMETRAIAAESSLDDALHQNKALQDEVAQEKMKSKQLEAQLSALQAEYKTEAIELKKCNQAASGPEEVTQRESERYVRQCSITEECQENQGETFDTARDNTINIFESR